MIATAPGLARSSLVTAGLAGALAVRLVVAGSDGAGSIAAGFIFAAALAVLAVLSGWKPAPLRRSSLVLGVLGGAVLIAIPAWLRLSAGSPIPFPAELWPLWASIVAAVAVAEELVLRGSLFTLLERAGGPYAAVVVTSVLFALLHVPLYGWGVVPIDLAAGVWLGGLRLVSGGPAAPTVAHVLADLAAWWLM